MKKLLSLLLAAALLMTLSVAAMADGIEKGTIVYGSSTELSGDWGREMWTNNAADKLVRELMDDYSTVASNQGGEFVVNPTIVKEMDSVVNEDGTKTFTVTINEGLVYNNGEPITAKDYVVESLFKCTQVAQDMGVMSALAETIVGGTAFQKGEAATVSGLRIVDEYTYSIQIVAEKLPYYYDLTYASAYPMNVTYWFGADIDVADDGEGCYFTGDFTLENVKDDVEAARFATGDRVTAGPYNLVSFDKGALQAILTINPNYAGNFEGVKPSIEKIVITRAEDATWADGIKTGAFNFFDTITDGDDINTALDIIDEGGFQYLSFDRAGYGKIQFQCDFGPTQFTAVRQAVAMLLDRNEFANTFCKGWGGVVNGPYSSGLWQYQECEEWLEENLNTYEYSYDGAVALLEADGWVYNADGSDYTEGLRYKKVTTEEAGDYAGNVTLADGTILMPLQIEWASSEGNPVSELLKVMLAENPDVAKAGMKINQTVMTFTELLNYIYRDESQGDKYAVKTYSMYNLATGFVPAYDYAYTFASDPESTYVKQGYNTNFIFDKTLDDLSMDMVYGIESDDTEGYLNVWREFIKRWNELLPEVPLYSNVYVTMYPDWLEGYTQDSFWDFQQAIVYCTVAE
ncbi:MAG: ABC transporter substrate-binding protein [Clostridiales bacterium]|nr:ABC transporter substrate-binding protein [Clostridiales bacterium]